MFYTKPYIVLLHQKANELAQRPHEMKYIHQRLHEPTIQLRQVTFDHGDGRILNYNHHQYRAIIDPFLHHLQDELQVMRKN
jgi:hypothetical protein